MTEAEWLASNDPTQMLEFLHGKASDRKLRLFAVACCRRIWNLLDTIGRKAVEVSEQFADGLASPSVLMSTENLAWWGADGLNYEEDPVWNAGWAAHAALEGGQADTERLAAQASGREGEPSIQAGLLRCIIGNHFRPVTVESFWLSWNNGTVPKIAKSIYDERAFDRLPILADALEDAGCADLDILTHCRQPGEHVRGCWVIDLLLGKA
jgi:hypothetical protein